MPTLIQGPGRLQSIRRAGSKLVFLDIIGEFEHVQAMCNWGKLSAGGVNAEQFKDLSRLLKRGDLVCTWLRSASLICPCHVVDRC